jgi:hypothetical protein
MRTHKRDGHLMSEARDACGLSPTLLSYPISTFDGLPRPPKASVVRDRKKKLLGKGHGETRLGRGGQTIRDYGEKGAPAMPDHFGVRNIRG